MTLMGQAATRAVAVVCHRRASAYDPGVRRAASHLLASWWAAASGYGVDRALPELANLPDLALDAITATHARRQP